MKLFEAIQYLLKEKNKPLRILYNKFTGTATFGHNAMLQYKEYNRAMTIIYQHKIVYKILTFFKII